MINDTESARISIVYDDGSEDRISPIQFFARYSNRIGGWFDPEGRFHEVGHRGFAEWAERNAGKTGVAKTVIPGFDPELQSNYFFWEGPMLLAGWARACTPHAFEVRAYLVHRPLRDVLVAVARAYEASGHSFAIEVIGRPSCFAAIGDGDGPERAAAVLANLKPEAKYDSPAEDFEGNYYRNSSAVFKDRCMAGSGQAAESFGERSEW